MATFVLPEKTQIAKIVDPAVRADTVARFALEHILLAQHIQVLITEGMELPLEYKEYLFPTVGNISLALGEGYADNFVSKALRRSRIISPEDKSYLRMLTEARYFRHSAKEIEALLARIRKEIASGKASGYRLLKKEFGFQPVELGNFCRDFLTPEQCEARNSLAIHHKPERPTDPQISALILADAKARLREGKAVSAKSYARLHHIGLGSVNKGLRGLSRDEAADRKRILKQKTFYPNSPDPEVSLGVAIDNLSKIAESPEVTPARAAEIADTVEFYVARLRALAADADHGPS